MLICIHSSLIYYHPAAFEENGRKTFTEHLNRCGIMSLEHKNEVKLRQKVKYLLKYFDI